MLRSLANLSTLLGKPSCHTLVGAARGPARLAAYWTCGCVASGATTAGLALAPCRTHRPRSIVAVAAEHVSAA